MTLIRGKNNFNYVTFGEGSLPRSTKVIASVCVRALI